MKPLVVILLLAISVQAQSLADAARKERERQAQFRAARVIVSTENVAKPAAEEKDAKTGEAKSGNARAAEADKAADPSGAPPPPPDPAKIWNERLNELRTRILSLEDQETALRLQVGRLSNQLYATVIDPDTQARVQTQLGRTQQQLITVRADVEIAKKLLDAMMLEGPPKK